MRKLILPLILASMALAATARTGLRHNGVELTRDERMESLAKFDRTRRSLPTCCEISRWGKTRFNSPRRCWRQSCGLAER